MPEQYIPRICLACGTPLKKLKTNRTLYVGGTSIINDVGMYFQDNGGKTTNIFGFYVCPCCGKMSIYEISLNKDVKKNE